MSIEEKYFPDQENCFLQSGKKFLAGRKLMHVEMLKYKRRMTGHKIDGAIGELSSTGNENVICYFECILFPSLLSVPLIAIDQQGKPSPF